MTDELRAAKDALTARRKVSRELARLYESELNAKEESALDQAVKAAAAGGNSRSAIAKIIGESRVTVNERLRRAHGEPARVLKAAPRAKGGVEVVEPELKPYLIEDPSGYLLVDYKDYGPDYVTGTGRFEIIKEEEDDGIYWFLSVGSDESVTSRLDTAFSGWYYEDALAFTVKALQEGKE